MTRRDWETVWANLVAFSRNRKLLDSQETVALTDEVIGLGFCRPKAGGLTWGSLSHLPKRKEFLETLPLTGPVVWRVAFRAPGGGADEQVELASDAAVRVEVAVEPSPDGTAVIMAWRGMPLGDEQAAVDVSLRITPGHTPGLLEWRLIVANRSRKLGIWHLECPCLSGLGSKDSPHEDVLGIARGWGTRYRNPLERGINYQVEYPSLFSAMQFHCLWNQGAGLYLAAHDPRASHKSFHFQTEQIDGRNTLSYWQRYFPSNMGVPKKDHEMTFGAIVGVYDGNWYDASRLYRTWALNQTWCARGPISHGRELLGQLGEVDVWAMGGMEATGTDLKGETPAQTLVKTKRFSEFMGARCGLHYYCWHQIEFDHELPDYFPAKSGFQEVVKELQQAGVVVMPYINARVWDPALSSWEEARRFATKNVNQEHFVEQYGAPLSPLCPATSFWQAKVAAIVQRLFTEFGVDGVYLDQVSSAPPTLCFDAHHGHAVGGGDFWWQGYREMLARVEEVRKAVKANGFITTESNAEPWNDKMWGYLMWVPNVDDCIPMYAVVYGDYTVPFGRLTLAKHYGNGIALWQFAQEFVWGSQLGWVAPDIIEKAPREAAFLRTLARYRSVAHGYLLQGQMLRPATVLSELPTLTININEWNLNEGEFVFPAVETATWRAPDGSVAVIFANASEATVALRFRLDLGETGLAARELTVSRLGAEGRTITDTRVVADVFEEEVVVGALDALILVLRAKN